MSSAIEYKECPRCKGVMFYELDCNTQEEYSFCIRCGLSYSQGEEEESFGRCQLAGKKGLAQSFSLEKPIDEDFKKWYSEMMEDSEINPEDCFLMLWDSEKKEVVPIFGKDPGTFKEMEKES